MAGLHITGVNGVRAHFLLMITGTSTEYIDWQNIAIKTGIAAALLPRPSGNMTWYYCMFLLQQALHLTGLNLFSGRMLIAVIKCPYTAETDVHIWLSEDLFHALVTNL